MPPTRERRWWTSQEDEILKNGARVQSNAPPTMHNSYMMVAFFSRLRLEANDYVLRNEDGSVQNWNDIAVLLPGCTNKDCRKRWSKVQLDIRKGAWTRDEDERLQRAVQQIGVKSVASRFPTFGRAIWFEVLMLTSCLL